ncbi:MAG: ShlB/FhaC/HecB family hemolysin secretion/activation protein [Rubrivivax sp.]
MLAPLPAAAQTAPPTPSTPSVVPRSSDLAPLEVVPPKVAPALPPAPPRELGKPEDDVRLDVTRYVVDDSAPAELRAALPRLTAAFVGKERSFESLVSAAAEVTRFLQRELGYYLGYAYLPEQTPQGGVIRIAVLEGRLDRVVLNWSDALPVDRAIVESYLARLVPGSVLKVRDVERVVFLLNDLRGITARFEVRAGSTPGTAALVVTPRAESRWTGRVDLDANGSRVLGIYRLGGLVQRNSPFGRGDGLTATALVSTTGGMSFALFGYTTPVGNDGFKVGTSLSAVKYKLDEEEFPLGLDGTATTFNAYALYPLVRSRNFNLFTLGSYERKSYADSIAGVTTKKNVDTLALGATGDFRDSLLGGGVNTYELSGVVGQVGYPGGRTPGLTDAEKFGKVTYGFTRLQDVFTNRMLFYVALRGQHAVRNLDTTEQFRVGGPEGVRAFASGEGTGDLGAVLSTELRFLPPEDWFGRTAREMVFSLFADAGYVRFRAEPAQKPVKAEANQLNQAKFGGYGIGLSWVKPDEFALRFSLSKPARGEPKSDPVVRDPRIYVQITRPFN